MEKEPVVSKKPLKCIETKENGLIIKINDSEGTEHVRRLIDEYAILRDEKHGFQPPEAPGKVTKNYIIYMLCRLLAQGQIDSHSMSRELCNARKKGVWMRYGYADVNTDYNVFALEQACIELMEKFCEKGDENDVDREKLAAFHVEPNGSAKADEVEVTVDEEEPAVQSSPLEAVDARLGEPEVPKTNHRVRNLVMAAILVGAAGAGAAKLADCATSQQMDDSSNR